MKCPFCNLKDTKVINSRYNEESNSVRRRRLCDHCGNRFTTYERIDMLPIQVIKNNGQREAFHREKLLNGIVKSCNKRPISMQEMEKIVDDIENKLMYSLEQEAKSKYIGELVMEHLKELDEVAYVRFASVYRQFKDINTFIDELNKIVNEKKN